ncbi:MAG: hypothetical protein HDT41_02730, partial [Lachnospiraceae bacterium]|nr:hypothetical protein [Lachnospiraceae bacterium]
MDENLINKIMSIAIETAIKVYEEKKENYFKEQKAQNVQKIKYILKKYRIMKEYMTCNHENVSDFQCEEYDEKLILENTIPEVIEQFDRALLILKSVYEKLGQPEDMRCYKIIEEL